MPRLNPFISKAFRKIQEHKCTITNTYCTDMKGYSNKKVEPHFYIFERENNDYAN